MSMRDSRSLRPEELSDRRRQAVALFRKGHTRIEIGEIVNVHRNVVGRWISDWQKKGEEAFIVRKKGRSKGQGMRLSGWQASLIKRLIIDKTPDQLKFQFPLWTREAVQQLISARLEVKLPIRTVGDYLKRWGFTPQKPTKRAFERNEKAVTRWLTEEFPSISARAKEEGAEIYWGDETGVRSDDVNFRGYAPRGKTPVVKKKGVRERLTMLSAITNRGKLSFTVFEGAVNAGRIIKFSEGLIRDTDRKVFLILDNLRVHHCKKFKEWLSERADQIEVFYLPKYSPDLNPDEFLNAELKRELRTKPDRRSKGVLEASVRSVAESLQNDLKKIVGCFRAPTTNYAA